MSDLIIGMGEIGTAVYGLFPDAQVLDLTPKAVEHPVENLHICFPWSDSFKQDMDRYIKIFSPRHIIIYSTVPIGTTATIPLAIHSPVEGKHPDLELSLRSMERWLGGDHEQSLYWVNRFQRLGISTKLVSNSKYTEALKLLSTAEYGVNIVFTAYKEKVAEELDMPFALTQDWNRAYNRLYRDLGLEKRFQKFVLDAPGETIGGHCIRENSIILDEAYPSDILKMIYAMKGRDDNLRR